MKVIRTLVLMIEEKLLKLNKKFQKIKIMRNTIEKTFRLFLKMILHFLGLLFHQRMYNQIKSLRKIQNNHEMSSSPIIKRKFSQTQKPHLDEQRTQVI